jgi:low affinity iron permease
VLNYSFILGIKLGRSESRRALSRESSPGAAERRLAKRPVFVTLIQIKLNELIRVSKAHNFFVGVERLTDEQIDEIRIKCEERAEAELVRSVTSKKTIGVTMIQGLPIYFASSVSGTG